MKSIEIDFVENIKARRLWLCTGIITLAIAAMAGFQWVAANRVSAPLKQRASELQIELLELGKPAEYRPPPRLDSTKAAAHFLQADLNLVFNTIENLRVPGGRLLSINVGLSEDHIKLEYQLDQMTGVADVSSRLNDGFEERPWRLQSATSSGNFDNMAGSKVTAVWTTSLSSLQK